MTLTFKMVKMKRTGTIRWTNSFRTLPCDAISATLVHLRTSPIPKIEDEPRTVQLAAIDVPFTQTPPPTWEASPKKKKKKAKKSTKTMKILRWRDSLLMGQVRHIHKAVHPHPNRHHNLRVVHAQLSQKNTVALFEGADQVIHQLKLGHKVSLPVHPREEGFRK